MDNIYVPDHNFSGLFCWCRETYESEGKDSDVTMIQCIVCTDWFHERCLVEERGVPLSDGEVDDASFICRDCVRFVRPYVTPLQFVDEEESVERTNRLQSLCSAICVAKSDFAHLPGDRSCFLAPDFRDFICKCENCTVIFTNMFVENDPIYEDEEQEEEEGAVISASLDGVLAKSFDNVCLFVFSGFDFDS